MFRFTRKVEFDLTGTAAGVFYPEVLSKIEKELNVPLWSISDVKVNEKEC